MNGFDSSVGGSGHDMDNDETFIKDRLGSAVDTLTPDVTALVVGGTTSGRAFRRQRRMRMTAGLTTAAVVVVTAFATGAVSKLVDSSPDPADQTLEQLVPATPRGLAAAVIEHTSSLGTLVTVGSYDKDADLPSDNLTIGLGYKTPDGVEVEIDVIATTDTSQFFGTGDGLCPQDSGGETCDVTTDPDGTKWVNLSQTQAGRTFLGVIRVEDASMVGVIEQVATKDAIPPWDAGDLRDVLDDPAIGLQTTQDANDAGAKIDDFKSNLGAGSVDSSSGGGSAAQPSAVTASVPADPASSSAPAN